MRRTLKKLVFVEPKSTHLHIYSRVCIPRLGSVLLATIMRAKGYDVRVYIEDIHEVGGAQVGRADLVSIRVNATHELDSYAVACLERHGQVRGAPRYARGGPRTLLLGM